MQDDFSKDVAAVARIDTVQKILEVICRTTGMGFSAVACAVRDEIAFGLKSVRIPGDILRGRHLFSFGGGEKQGNYGHEEAVRTNKKP